MRILKKVLILIFVVSLTTVGNAQVPESLNFQAEIRGIQNELIANSPLGIRLSILKGSESGEVVYTEIHNISTDSLGILNLLIGGGTPSLGLFSLINWSNDSYYIKSEIDPNGGADYSITGMAKLQSVPYALYAKHSGDSCLWSKTNTGISYNNGYVGVGTNEPYAPFSVVNDSSFIRYNENTAIADFQRTIGNSTARFLIYGYPDTDDVLPHMRKSAMLYATSDAKDLIIAAAQETGRIRFFTKTWVTPENEKMIIDSNGNVGIGNSEPKSKLQVTNGDVYLDSVNAGVIMTSPNGKCWKMTVDDNGGPVFTEVNCL
jgi:hypothetical protein